jgi:hypothetical protein
MRRPPSSKNGAKKANDLDLGVPVQYLASNGELRRAVAPFRTSSHRIVQLEPAHRASGAR